MPMRFYSVEPEIAGAWGDNTVYTRSVGKRVVHKLHCEFDEWLGDQLVESRACFIVTTRLARDIERAQLTGASFDAVEVTTSDMFNELYPNRVLPRFVWLKVAGRAKRHDFGVASNLLLVVSERAHDVLTRAGIMDAATFTLLDG
jgi:hypothetical protein